MKVLGIVCSPRKGGNTEILVREALSAVNQYGYETELVLVADMNISFCDGCGACMESGICKLDDDMQAIYQKLLSADGIIFGTPVYFTNVSAQAKTIIDRTYAFLRERKLAGKVAGVIVAARRVGAGQVRSLLYSYFVGQRMIIASASIGYGHKMGEVKEGPGGAAGSSAVEEARAVGKNVVKMLRTLQDS